MHRIAACALRQAAAAACPGGTPHTWQQRPLRVMPQQTRRALPASRAAVAPVTAIATPWPLPGLREAVPVAPPRLAPSTLQHRVGRLWELYLESLARRPLLTKAATSFVCCVIGDSIAQALGGAPYSLARVARLAVYSASVGATTGHYWHRWLDANVHPEEPTASKTVFKKTAADQMLLSPIMTAVFFCSIKLLEGRPEGILPMMQDKYISTVLTGWALWWPWNIVSFRLIPQDLRILAGNLVGIGWGTFMSVSCLNSPTVTVCPALDTPAGAAVGMQAPPVAAHK